MRVVAFAGPSRPATLHPAIEWRPPAGAGDLLALLADRPDRVVLIDGLFDVRPAPWHKEILALIEQGIIVIGAASMGALRAAELADHGMIGSGAIYRACRTGQLVADDEVAVLHAPAELQWRPLTEALVDIRATLLAARRARRIDSVTARIMLTAARNLNFRERSWPTVLERAGRSGARIDGIAAWLRGNRIDLKRRDAARAIDLALSGLTPPPPVRVPRTVFLTRLAATIGVTLPDP